MLTFTDYALENVPGLREYQKKKDEEEKKKKIFGDIAPVASTYLTGGVPNSGTLPYAAAPQPEITAPVRADGYKWYEGYLKKGALEEGNVGKAALGTSTDIAKNLLTGAAGIVESGADFLAGLAPLMMEQQLIAEGGNYSEGEKKLYQEAIEKSRAQAQGFIQQELVDEENLAKRIIASVYAKADPLNQLLGVWAPVAKGKERSQARYDEAMAYMEGEMEQNSLLDAKSDALLQSAGQLAVQMAVAPVVPWWATSGVTAMGGEMENALNQGATLEQAVGSGMVTAAAEILSEQISGAIKFGGKTLDEGITKAIARSIPNKVLQSMAKLGLDAFGEGSEEVVSTIASEIGQWLTYRNDEELKELLWSEEAIQQKIDAFVGGYAMGGLSSGGKAVMAEAKGMDYVSGMTKNEKAVVDKVYRDAVDAETAAAKDGKISGKRKREIYDEVLKQLERGDISTETIRDVLGGESYQQYKKSEAEWAEMEQEYDQLYNMKNGEKSSKQVAREAFLKEKLESQEAQTKREDAAKKYTQGIQDIALKDRLGESYRQQGQRGVAFEADLNQYSGKAQETVQKAVEAGILNNTRKTHDFVDLIAKIADRTGQTFNFTDNQRLKESGFAIEGKQVNGYISADGITLNINSPKALNRVVGHEVMHVLQEAGLTDALTKKLFDYADSKGELAARRKAVEALYDGRDANIDEELAAELVGDYLFSNEDFVRQLHRDNLTVFEKVWDELKRVAKMATAGSKEARELARIEKMFGEVYRDAKDAKNTTPEGAVRYSMSGQNSQTADKGALSRAMELQEQGVSNESIRQKTGWFVGRDGKWRYEIDDSRMEISDNISNYMRLGDLMQHDALYAAYPDLADIDVVFQSLEPGVSGSYSPQFDSINLSSRLKNDPYGIKHSLAHELQHAIQRREGFATGATVGLWERKKRQGFDSRRAEDIRKAQEAERELRRIQEEEPEFYRDMLELDAMTPDLPRGEIDWETLEKIEDDPIEWQQYDARREELEAKYGDTKVWDMNDLLYQREQAAKDTGRSALELYYDTAGEIEAREVAARQRMTPEQRKNSPPRLGDENTVFAESNSYAEEYIPGDVSAAELESGINYVAEMSSVSAISGTEFTTEGRTLLDDVDRFFKSVGGQVYNARLGDINLTRRGVKDSLAHGMTPQKAAAFSAIPDVLRNGKVVGFEKNWKGRGYDSATVAAPVTIGGEEYIMAVVVHRSNSANRFYVHDVIAVKKEATPFMTGAQNLGKPGGATSTISIIKRILDVKGQTSLSLADDLAPVARAGEVYGEDIGIEAPVREDLEAGNVPYSGIEEVAGADPMIRQLREETSYLESILNSDKDTWVSRKARDMLQELNGLKVGKRASEELSYLLDLRAETDEDYSSLRAALTNIRYTPGSVINSHSKMEAAARALLEEAFPKVQAEAKQKYESRIAAIESGNIEALLKDEVEVRNAREEIQALRENSRAELNNTRKLRQEAFDKYTEKIDSAQALYDSKKNKETKLAQNLLRRIERLKRLQADNDVQYAKRIAAIEKRMAKTEYQLISEKATKTDYDRAIAKIDRYLELDKADRAAEYDAQMETLADKDAWKSKKALELYQELRRLKRGKKASAELSYLLDLRAATGDEWDVLRSALVNARRSPSEAINSDSSLENAVREVLETAYESEMAAVEMEYDEDVQKLEAEADEKRQSVATAQQRKVKHAEHAEFVKNLIGDTTHWVDKPLGIQYATNTLQRNLRDIVRGPDGKPDLARAQALYEAFGGEYNHHEAQLKQEDNAIKKWYLDQKITKEESVYIQMLGEFLHNPDTTVTPDMVEAYAKEHKDKINQEKVYAVIERARADYDALFERLNKVLRENGMKEIPYRKGYFPHLKMEGEESLLAKVLKWKTKNGDQIPTSIAGMTEQFEPTRSYQSFNKQRQGDTTEYDFRKGFDAYVHGALDWIYHIEDIQKRREFENYIRYIHSEEGIKEKIDKVLANDYLNADEVQDEIDHILKEANNPLGNFITDFRTQTNLLAAKKHSLDRGMEQMINRDVYSVASQISSRVSANMVAGSVSAAMSNIIPITQSWAEVNPTYTLVGLQDTIRSLIRDDGMVEQSDFLTNRLIQEEKLDTDTWDKISDKVGWLMKHVDQLTSQTVWRSKYRQNLSKGMSEAAAIKDADDYTERLMAGRSRGNQPTLFEAKNLVAKLFTSFQLEVNNQYGYLFKDLPAEMRNESKAKLAGAYAKVFIGAYLYNELSRAITGRDMAFDPIRILQSLIGGMADEEEDDSEDIVAFVDDILENTPFIGGLMGGGRVPISSALPYDGSFKEGVAGVAKAWETGDWKAVLKELQNPLYYLLPPMGGGQIRKTVQGLSMYSDKNPVAGSYTDSGALRFTAGTDIGSIFQAALFGQWAGESAQQYIEEGRTPLSGERLDEFLALDIPIAQYWEIRDGLKGLKTVNEKADYIASLDLSTKQKNLLINNIADRKTPIDMAGYDKYADFEEMDFAVKNPELYKWLQSQGMTLKDYEASGSAKKAAYSWAAKNPEKYAVSRAVTDNLVQYRTYTKAINKMEANKDADGKTISGSRQKKIVAYINGLDLDYGAKIILYRMAYQSDDSYNYEIVEYLNSRKDLTYNDMKTILEELGMAVDKEGNVTW